jgi:endonuclease/exonuclease/phosphatase family metal-dependent hydrolase
MRLLSYNIHKGIGGRDRLCRLERVIDVIEAENPDILCLQEVARNSRRSHYHDQAQLLSDYFKLPEHLYQMNVHLKGGGYGNLILSRWPILAKHQISLRFNSKKPRGAQLAVIDTPEGHLHVVNFHLGLSDAERHWQIEHLLNHHLFKKGSELFSAPHEFTEKGTGIFSTAEKRSEPSAARYLPTLLVGDYNDWRNRLHRAALWRHGFQQITHPASRFRSFPAYLALGSLDKAFSRGHLFVRHARIVHTPLSRKASDHLPLVIDFHLDQSRLNGHT